MRSPVSLRRPPYSSLAALLEQELVAGKDPATVRLIQRLRLVKRRGWFSRGEFLAMCRWKSPRSLRHCERNPAARIHAVSRAVLATRDERERLSLLTSLAGVSVPTASAILTLIDPRRYGVLDIRVWQLLYVMGTVTRKSRGVGFTGNDWLAYLTTLRREARALGVSVRKVEYSLFECHRKHQRGTLYRRKVASGTTGQAVHRVGRRIGRASAVRQAGGREEHRRA